MSMSIVPLVVGIAEASTGSGVETAMGSIVTLIIAVAVLACVGAAAWVGVKCLMAHDMSHIWQSFVGLGIGGGLIAGARVFGAQLTGSASAFSLLPLAPDPANVLLGDGVGLLLSALPLGLFFLATLHTRRHVAHV